MSDFHTSDSSSVPSDWKAYSIGEIGRIKNGINKPKGAFGSGYPFVNLNDVFGRSQIASVEYLDLLQTTPAERDKYNLQEGDVLFIRSSVKPSGVGLTAVVTADLNSCVFSGFLLRFRESGILLTEFKEYCFSASYFRNALISSSSVSANTNINQSALAGLILLVPPAHEQQAIAAALSDVDGLVAGLERVIAKKRLIKQGAMQDLLTARRRLPGFSGEWEYKSLGSVSAFITKGATPTTYGFEWQSHGVLFLRSECVGPLGLDLSQSMFICDHAHKILNRSEVRSGDVLITITGNVGRVVRLPAEFAFGNINQHIARIRVSSISSSGEYVFQQLSQQKFVKYFNSIVTGQAYPQISLRQVREAVLPFPSLKEQYAIAAVLSDMDAEIQTLEARLAKARAVKEGMMQNLLTGRVRLV